MSKVAKKEERESLSIEAMPAEICRRFLAYMDSSAIASFSQVSLNFKKISSLQTKTLNIVRSLKSNENFSFLPISFPLLQNLFIQNMSSLDASSIMAIANLEHLKTFQAKNISQLSECRISLIVALSKCKKLESLEINFGKFSKVDLENDILSIENGLNTETQGPEQLENSNFSNHWEALSSWFSVDVSPLSSLARLTHLVIHNAPSFWNARQSKLLSIIGSRLESLEISYRVSPSNLDFLASLNNIRRLRLFCENSSASTDTNAFDVEEGNGNFGQLGNFAANDDSSDPHSVGKVFKLPFMPRIEELALPQWCVTSESLKTLKNSLRMLSFTPWGWRRADLACFGDMPLLAHLEMKVNWLPAKEYLDRSLRHLTSLTLIDFEARRLESLSGLINLHKLCINAPTSGGMPAKVRHLSLFGQLLPKLKNLTSFSLLNVNHLSDAIKNAILAPESKISVVELSGCSDCIQDFINTANDIDDKNFDELALHVDGMVHSWKKGDFDFATSKAISRVDSLPQIII